MLCAHLVSTIDSRSQYLYLNVHEDLDFVELIKEALESFNIDVWFDKKKIIGGGVAPKTSCDMEMFNA